MALLRARQTISEGDRSFVRSETKRAKEDLGQIARARAREGSAQGLRSGRVRGQGRGARGVFGRNALLERQRIEKSLVEQKRGRERRIKTFKPFLNLPTPAEEQARFDDIFRRANEAIANRIPTKFLSGHVFQVVQDFRKRSIPVPTRRDFELKKKVNNIIKLPNIPDFLKKKTAFDGGNVRNVNSNISRLQRLNSSSNSSNATIRRNATMQRILNNSTLSPRPFSKRLR